MAAPTAAWRKYLLQFANEHLEFRMPELFSIAKVMNTPIKLETEHDGQHPYVIASFQSEDHVRKILQRSMLIKAIYELWGQGKDYDELFASLKTYPQDLQEPYLDASQTFKINVDTYNKTLKMGAKISRVERVLDGPFVPRGKIKLKNPSVEFHIHECYDYNFQRDPEDATPPQIIYFGRIIGGAQRELATRKYNLQSRSYIGNTSMDPGLALLMSNQGLVEKGSLIYDPFVGTGSLLIACAHFGGYVAGSDIDYKLLHGIGKSSRAGQKWRKQDECLRTCMKDYNLGEHFLDVIIGDSSKLGMIRQQPTFDAIITDPPYGIREQTKQVGTKGDEPVEIPEDMKVGHVPSKTNYSLSNILTDLLNFAAKTLKLGGRLVYWLPVYRSDYTEKNIPTHQCLDLIGNSEQVFNPRVSRRLITMVKAREGQTDEELNSACIPLDLYSDESFRDKYFRPLSKDQELEAKMRAKHESSPDKPSEQSTADSR